MIASHDVLDELEAKTLRHLDSVDFLTPMKQLDDVLDAMLEVPTWERHSDTHFARDAAVAVDRLVLHTHRLLERLHTLSEHVHGCQLPKVL